MTLSSNGVRIMTEGCVTAVSLFTVLSKFPSFLKESLSSEISYFLQNRRILMYAHSSIWVASDTFPKLVWYASMTLANSFSPSQNFSIAVIQVVSLSTNQNGKTAEAFALSRPPYQNRQSRSNSASLTSTTPES